MTVKITNFETYEYTHADAPDGSHGGTLDPATVIYGTNMDGSPNLDVVIVPCPVDGYVSCWPPGGGADALYGQLMHVQVAMNPPTTGGASRSGETRTALTLEEATAQVKARVIATDGEERWVLDEAAMAALATRRT